MSKDGESFYVLVLHYITSPDIQTLLKGNMIAVTVFVIYIN